MATNGESLAEHRARQASEAPRPIWLRTEGGDIVVLVQEGGEWEEVIREKRSGEISHIWEDS